MPQAHSGTMTTQAATEDFLSCSPNSPGRAKSQVATTACSLRHGFHTSICHGSSWIVPPLLGPIKINQTSSQVDLILSYPICIPAYTNSTRLNMVESNYIESIAITNPGKRQMGHSMQETRLRVTVSSLLSSALAFCMASRHHVMANLLSAKA